MIIGAAAVGCGALVPHLGHRRIWTGIVAVGVVLGIIVTVHELASDSSHPAKPPTKKPAKTTP
jgi:hypothetical protein